MARHDPAHLAAGELGCPARHVRVRQAVETVLAQCPAPPPLQWQRVGGRLIGNRRVERGVEARYRRYPWQQSGHQVEAGQRRGLMQRRQAGQVAELCSYLLVDEHGGPEPRAAVHDSVTYYFWRHGAFDEFTGSGVVSGAQVRLADDGLAVEQAELEAA